jgi:hypothetical protein
MLIGTTTDAGHRLDVNGTVRGQSGLWGGDVFLGNISGSRFLYLPSGYGLFIGSVGNVPTVLGDSTFSTTLNATINRFTLTHTQGSEQVTKLVGGSSVNHLNPVFDIVASVTSSPPKEIDMRIYTDYYSGTQRWGNIILGHNGNNTAGNILMGTNIGNGSRLLVGGVVSGSTFGFTRGVHVSPTLLATGNTTTLIGLDIQPTFTPGSFTGLTQLALRVSGGTQIIGSGSTGTTLSLFSVDGASGRLFDVTDDFSNSLFSVNTSSGVPVIEAFANNSIVMGTYGSNALVVSGRSTYFGVIPSDSNYRIISSGATLFSGGTMVIKGSGTTSGSTALSVQNSSGGTLMNLFDNGNLNIDNGVLYVNGDTGNVGIGTTSPSEKLSISAGNMSMESGRFIKFNYSTPFWIGADGTANGFTIFDATASLRRFSITTAGNVLIGTTTDNGYKLNVNGSAYISGAFIVNTSSGISLGVSNTTSTYSLAFGYQTSAGAAHSIAGIWGANASGNSSLALGRNSSASNESSIAIGESSSSGGLRSTALTGGATAATGTTAIGPGTYTYMYGQSSFSSDRLTYGGDSQYTIQTARIYQDSVTSGTTGFTYGLTSGVIKPSNGTYSSGVKQNWLVEARIMLGVRNPNYKFNSGDIYTSIYTLALKSNISTGTQLIGTPQLKDSFYDSSFSGTSVSFTIGPSNNLLVTVVPPSWTGSTTNDFRGTLTLTISELGIYG